MYRPTDVSNVSQGTVMDANPSNKATSGANATIMMASFSATWDNVKYGSPLQSWLHTKTIAVQGAAARSEEHTSELQSLMRISYAVFCLKKKKQSQTKNPNH